MLESCYVFPFKKGEVLKKRTLYYVYHFETGLISEVSGKELLMSSKYDVLNLRADKMSDKFSIDAAILYGNEKLVVDNKFAIVRNCSNIAMWYNGRCAIHSIDRDTLAIYSLDNMHIEWVNGDYISYVYGYMNISWGAFMRMACMEGF